MKSSEQHYAQTAYQAMNEKLQPETREIFGVICHHFPSMVRLNGLHLTVIYYESQAASSKKEGSPKSEAYRHYLQYLNQALDLGNGDLVQEVNRKAVDAKYYRMITRQALAASVWFKRYAEVILQVEASEEWRLEPE